MPRQTPPLASRLVRVSRARRRCSGSAAGATAAPVAGSTQQRGVVAGRQAQLGPPGAQPVQRPATAAASPERQPGQLRGGGRRRAAAGTPGRCRPAPPCAGSPRAARPARRRPGRRRTATKPARAATPPLISSAAKWSSSTTSARPHAGHRADRVVRVGHHQEGEVRRAEVGRQPQPHLGVAVGGHRRRRRRSRASVTGSSSSGSRTSASAAQHAVPHRGQRRAASRRLLGPAAASSRGGRLAGLLRQPALGRHLDVVERRGVQAEDLLLGGRGDPRVVGELVAPGSPSRRSPRPATSAPRCA